jgi:outer membrane immunogenic protein
MLRNLLLSTVLVASAGSALAADLPYRTAAPAPYVAAPMFTWTGFYVGLNAGAAFNGNNSGSISSFGLIAPNNAIYTGGGGSDDASFTGGATAGYNMQFGSFVAGVEADINYLDRQSGGNGVFPAPVDVNGAAGFTDRTDFAVTRGGNDNWFGTLRGRIGFAFDRALIYGTGGLAFGGKTGGFGVTQRDYIENGLTPGNGTFTSTTRGLVGTGGSDNNIGWTLGGGLEYAFTNSISLKAEYLHVNLGDNTRTFTTLASAPGTTMTAGNTITVRDTNKFDVVRAGVNFRF